MLNIYRVSCTLCGWGNHRTLVLITPMYQEPRLSMVERWHLLDSRTIDAGCADGRYISLVPMHRSVADVWIQEDIV